MSFSEFTIGILRIIQHVCTFEHKDMNDFNSGDQFIDSGMVLACCSRKENLDCRVHRVMTHTISIRSHHITFAFGFEASTFHLRFVERCAPCFESSMLNLLLPMMADLLCYILTTR